jgi:hypothetical protein
MSGLSFPAGKARRTFSPFSVSCFYFSGSPSTKAAEGGGAVITTHTISFTGESFFFFTFWAPFIEAQRRRFL